MAFFAVFMLACISLGCSTVIKNPEIHLSMSESDLLHYFGVRSVEKMPEYHITYPRALKNGDDVIVERSAEPHDESLTVELELFGDQLQIQLEKTPGLLVPGAIIQEIDARGTSKIHVRDTHSCYRGKVVSRDNSRAALCNVDGVHGMINLNGDNLVIQPLRHGYDARVRRDNGDPHVVYKRQVDDSTFHGIGKDVLTSNKIDRRHNERDTELVTKHIETLMVADHTMYGYHGEALEQYILTIANVVADRFAEPSIGANVYFHLDLLKDFEGASDILDEFCRYQKTIFVDDDDSPLHFDSSVILTRKISGGLAGVGTACSSRPCALCGDTGLMPSALAMAHELGHTMRFPHDGNARCRDGAYIMSTVTPGGVESFEWSICSTEHGKEYFGSSQSACFNDDPMSSAVIDITLNGQRPGLYYNMDQQCKFSWSSNTTVCPQLPEGKCETLYCMTDSRAISCVGNLSPPLEGSQCGETKWCIRGRCVDWGDEGPAPVNGGWSDYDAEFSECSRSCGGGIRAKRRYCNNPEPAYNGDPCPGSENAIYEMCNMQECSTPQTTLPEEECSSLDSADNYYVPRFSVTGDDFCASICYSPITLYLSGLGRPFLDGTRCDFRSRELKICATGKCLDFGCDGIHNSESAMDKCGICGGNDDTCEEVTGSFSLGEQKEYITVMTIPAGSSDIEIIDESPVCALGLKVDGEFILGGDGKMEGGGLKTVANKHYYYRDDYYDEVITIYGKMTVDLEVLVYQQYPNKYGKQIKPKITYTYYQPLSTTVTSAPNTERPITTRPAISASWRVTEGACSKTCGTGTGQPVITCVRDNDSQQVDESNCDSNTKPSSDPVPCSMPDCPQPRWESSDWKECDITCGGGSRSRDVKCVVESSSGEDEVVDDASCDVVGPKPATTESCSDNPCPTPTWQVGEFSECSVTCGEGVKTRDVTCRSAEDTDVIVPDGQCQSTKPTISETCETPECSEGGCLYEPNTNRPGYDLNDGNQNKVANREECCQSCRDTDGCTAWSFFKDETKETFGACWLKKPWTNGKKNKSGVDSGLMNSQIIQGDGCRFQTNILQVGEYINGSKYSNDGGTNVVASREECCEKCRSEPGCKAFAFVKTEGPRFGECWYINTESSVTDNDCCDGGVLTE